jgi:hypothetical protein
MCFHRLLILQVCHLVTFTSSQNKSLKSGSIFSSTWQRLECCNRCYQDRNWSQLIILMRHGKFAGPCVLGQRNAILKETALVKRNNWINDFVQNWFHYFVEILHSHTEAMNKLIGLDVHGEWNSSNRKIFQCVQNINFLSNSSRDGNPEKFLLKPLRPYTCLCA